LDPALAREGQDFDRLRRQLAEALIAQKKAHGLKVFQRQMTQRRLADAACALYGILAVLTRAQGAIAAGLADDNLLLWTRHAASENRRLIERSFAELTDNADELSSRIAAAECARIGAPLEEKVS
jgi:hypothetical protein